VEASALGAAIIGAAGTGAFDSLSDAADAMTSAKPGYTPDPGLRKIYDDLFEVYKGVFPVLQKQIHSLSDTIERHSAG
jgi:ribulose kinase